MREQLLPYFDERNAPVEILMFHCNTFDLKTFLGWMRHYQTSAHYFIAEDGKITRLIPEEKRAFHAGQGQWKGKGNLNARSIGIELQNAALGQQPYPPKQISALIELSRDILSRFQILPDNIIGHSDAAPERKADPGVCFPWQYLSEQGIGLYPDLKNFFPENNCAVLLKSIGYDTNSQEALCASAYAFCRHFAPQFVTKEKNISRLLDNVLPPDFCFMRDAGFLTCLQAVAHTFNKIKQG